MAALLTVLYFYCGIPAVIKFQYPVSPRNQPLAKEPENPGHKDWKIQDCEKVTLAAQDFLRSPCWKETDSEAPSQRKSKLAYFG